MRTALRNGSALATIPSAGSKVRSMFSKLAKSLLIS